MPNESQAQIKVVDIISGNKFDQYQLQISYLNNNYVYYARFSHLRRLFKNISCESARFPSRCSVLTSIRPILSQKFVQDFKKCRLEDLKHYFSEISSKINLIDQPQFLKLKQEAKEWEKSIMKQKRPMGKSLGNVISLNKNNLVYVIS